MLTKANVLIPFYSSYGHTHALAEAVERGAAERAGSVRLRRIPELPAAREAMSGQEAYDEAQARMASIPEVTHDDLRWADGIIWGTPTRFGNMSAQMKQFLDTLGGLWFGGELEDKAAGVFVSTGTIHGGHESTILTSLVPLLHLGMVFVGVRYAKNPQIMTTEGIGGSPYGPSTMAGPDGTRQPVEEEFETARNLGRRVAQVAAQLKGMRAESASTEPAARAA